MSNYTDAQLEALINDDLPRWPWPWRISDKGNLWRREGPLTLTLFRRGNRWAYCIADRKPRYSARSYLDVQEAMAAALDEARGQTMNADAAGGTGDR